MESKPVVLGLDIAAAQAAERARLAAGGLAPSPLSGKAYDAEQGEFDLTTLVESPLDSEVSGVVETWRASGSGQREDARRALSLDDNYTLIQFARRMAVRALNEPSSDACELGLTALTMIDESRIDPRDASWAAGLLNHAAGKQPGHSGTLFDRVIAVATPGMAELLRGSRDSTLEDWGYREWRRPTGTGLIRTGWARYEPTVDLAALAHQIASRILRDRYIVDIEVAAELPFVWFDKSRREHAAEVLERSPGIVAIHGSLRRIAGGTAGQMWVLWIAEVLSPADSVRLVADVGDGAALGGRFAFGVSAGRLFALLVAGSCQDGVEPVDSPAALKDLGGRIRALLEESTE